MRIRITTPYAVIREGEVDEDTSDISVRPARMGETLGRTGSERAGTSINVRPVDT